MIDEPFGPAAGWALETNDAFVLSKVGCLETLARRAADGSIEPMLAASASSPGTVTGVTAVDEDTLRITTAEPPL